ncbi:tetratricopeptide repeat protein 14 [Nephila pilipes]|uniref:Tetratricopeptide repeat protein 14 n=1 Tax=Nephila pilipes TaxID=299642 RepID=A0A8X6PU19_NEPPI|nr:tetratricopeptide repeat protein 14 [Nephila pilipes]
MDQYRWAKALHSHGPTLMNAVVGNLSHENLDDNDNQHLLELMQKKSHRLLKKLVPNPAEEKKLANDIGLQPVPPEIYRKNLTITQRRRLFFQTLFHKDILYLRVVNIRNPYDYKLQVVAKHGNCMRLEDLQLIMYLPKIPEETKFFKGGLWEFEYIRGALCSCSVNERKLFVTLDPLIFEGAEAPTLGKVGVNDLPFSLWCPEIGMSIYGYLIKSRVFYKAHLETILRNVLGIEGNQHYSLFQEWDRQKFPLEETPANFPKLFDFARSSAMLRRSIRLYIVGDIKKAFKYANKALSINPDAVYTRLCRGVLNVRRGNMTDAFVDTQDCLKLDHKNELAQKQMSALLIVAAEKYFEKRDFTKLYKTLLVAIGLNPSHFKGPAVVETFKVVRYIYQMTRDPEINFPFAPTHQKILSRFFKNEGSLRRKFVLPPSYDDQLSIPPRASQIRQAKQLLRNEERPAGTEHYHNHHRKRSKSGSKRQRSRSRSVDLNRRLRSGSRTLESNQQRESRNRLSKAIPDIICLDSTSSQERSYGLRASNANRAVSVDSTSNQQRASVMRMRNACQEGASVCSMSNQQHGSQINNADYVIDINSTSNQQQVSGTWTSNLNRSVDSVVNAPNLQCASVTRKSKANQAVSTDSHSNQQLESGTLTSNTSQEINSFDYTSNQQGGSGMLINSSRSAISVEHTPNLQRRFYNQKSNTNLVVCVDSTQDRQQGFRTQKNSKNQAVVSVNCVSNQQLCSGRQDKNTDNVVPIHSTHNQLGGTGTQVSHVNQRADSTLNDQPESGMLKSNTSQSIESMPNQPSGSRIGMNNANLGVSVHSRPDQLCKAKTQQKNFDQAISIDFTPNQLTGHETSKSNLNRNVRVDSMPEQQHGSEALTISENRFEPVFFTNIHRQGSGTFMGNWYQRISGDSTLSKMGRSQMLKNKANRGISFDSVSNHPCRSGIPKNKRNKSPRKLDNGKKRMGKKYFDQSHSFDGDEHIIDLDLMEEQHASRTKTRESGSNQGIPVDFASNQQRGIRTPKSIRNQIAPTTMPNQQHDPANRTSAPHSHDRIDSTSNELGGSGTETNNWTRHVSINSCQEQDCERQVSVLNPNVFSVEFEPNEQCGSGTVMKNANQNVDCSSNQEHGSGMGVSDENEDVICISPAPNLHELEAQISNEDEDIICIDYMPNQKPGSKSHPRKLGKQRGSACCTCDQHKRHGSRCRKCDVDKKHRTESPSYYEKRHRSGSPLYYREKRHRSGSRSSIHRHKRHGSRSRSSGRDKRCKSRSRSPDNPYKHRSLGFQF